MKNDNERSNDPQIKWEFPKYQIRTFTLKFSNMRAKKNENKDKLETTLKLLEKN